MRKGKTERAYQIFKYILELYPRSLDGLFRVAEMYLSKGRYKMAIHYYREFLKIRPNEAIIQYKLKNAEKMLKDKGGNDK
jgi:tetratricopeptide (TPR) repeat protein